MSEYETSNSESRDEASETAAGLVAPIGPGPDYVVKQYRQIKTGTETQRRAERIGVAWQNANGSICVRLNGVQLISNDVFLFPQEQNTPS